MREVCEFWSDKTGYNWTAPESTRSYFEKQGYKIDDKGRIIIEV